MRLPTQGLLLLFLGAVLLRLAGSDAYLRYVVEWMKWPLLVSGVLLLLLAIGPLFRDDESEDDEEHAHGDLPTAEHGQHGHGQDGHGQDGHGQDGHGQDGHGQDGHGHGVPRVTWLLVLPGIIAFVVSPPELGAYLAERRSNDMVAVSAPTSVIDLDSEGPVELGVAEFLYLAQAGEPALEGQFVVMSGFVSYGAEDDWYLTRMQIGCCAADAMAYRIKVEGAERPARDQWVEVTGTHVTGTGVEPPFEVELTASEVVEIDAPTQTYE